MRTTTMDSILYILYTKTMTLQTAKMAYQSLSLICHLPSRIYSNSIKDCDFLLSDFVGGDRKVGFNYSRSFAEML
jgi:hypothetical protein